MSRRDGTAGIWLGFAACGLLGTLASGVAGTMVASPEAREAVWIGCLASWLGGLAGSVPLARLVARGGSDTVAAIGRAGLWRFLVALSTGLVAVKLGPWPDRPLLFALAASYVVLLGVETWWLLRLLRARARAATIGR